MPTILIRTLLSMKDIQYKHIENTLRELAFFIHQCRIEEEKENFKKQFYLVKNTTAPLKQKIEASKPNKKRKATKQVWTEKEIQIMPYLKDLKYRKTSDGIHQFRYRKNGFNLSFNSKEFEVAKQKAYDFIKTLKNKIRSEADVLKGHTLDFVAQAWMKLKQEHTDKATFRAYENVYKNHIEPVFGKRSIKGILPIDLQPYFDELFKRYERTTEDAKIILNGIFKYAMANRIIPSNPMDAVIVNKHIRKKGAALTNDQIKRFKETMLKTENPFGLAGLIILYSGIRGAELQSMTFNWDNETFTVKNAKLKKSQKIKPENEFRTVPIFEGLKQLKDRIQTEEWKIEAKTLSNNFTKFWKENTVKDLRHTFTTKARESGIENELVNIWTGHLPGSNQTANTYTHFSLEYQKKEAKKLEEY